MKLRYMILGILTLATTLCADSNTFQMTPDAYNYQTGYTITESKDKNNSGLTELVLPTDVDVWKAGNIVKWKFLVAEPMWKVNVLPPNKEGQKLVGDTSNLVNVMAGDRSIGYLAVTNAEGKSVSAQQVMKATLTKN